MSIVALNKVDQEILVYFFSEIKPTFVEKEQNGLQI